MENKESFCLRCIYLANNKQWCSVWEMEVFDGNRVGAVSCTDFFQKDDIVESNSCDYWRYQWRERYKGYRCGKCDNCLDHADWLYEEMIDKLG